MIYTCLYCGDEKKSTGANQKFCSLRHGVLYRNRHNEEYKAYQKAYQKQYRQNNKLYVKEKMAEFHAKHPHYSRDYARRKRGL